ncbi:MAG: hypothetical protein U5R14_04890 [Gemmatimonadota bacterium]|nr:hypothetical protein [Gemmatimonadota bacterium]
MSDLPLDPIAIDVGRVLQHTETSLCANLVTRPTGRAVRVAIETRLRTAGASSLSLIDFSEVRILDFSCADEVVAKLLQRYVDPTGPEAFFVFRGIHEPHRDQVEYVLRRQGLLAVAETAPSRFELLGDRTGPEERVWGGLERLGLVPPPLVREAAGSVPQLDSQVLEALVRRRVAFRSPVSGRIHALSQLVRHLL